jgi:hypothetical protein
MTTSKRNTVLILAIAAIGAGLALFAWRHWHAEPTGHGLHADHAGHAGLSLDDGRKWATDESLRRGMARIQALVAAPAPGNPGQTADAIRQEVAAMVANCRLEPKADAVLHALIGDLLAGADDLARPETAARGLAQVRETLAQYARYFDHPGWLAPAPMP